MERNLGSINNSCSIVKNMLDALKNIFSPVASGRLWTGDSDDVIILHDEYGRIERVSDAAATLLGRAIENIEGRCLTDFISAEDRGRFLAHLIKVQSSKAKSRIECRFVRPTGERIWMEISASLDDKGRLRSIARDIEERHQRYTTETSALKKAEEEVESRTNYLADLSHEIRTPLSALIGFADVMRSETFGPMGNDKYSEYAELIHQSGQHLLTLVSDLLDMSKIEAGKFVLHKEETDLIQLIQECSELFQLEAEKAGLWLKFDTRADIGLQSVDGKTIRQILMNLLSNAIKFTKTGGINVRLRADKENIWISVIDTGVGIAQEHLNKMGQRFEQAHAEGVRGAKGTGLGLSLCHALAELHDGELRLASKEGQGTKAVIRLPRNDLQAATQEDDETISQDTESTASEPQQNDPFDRLADELNAILPTRKAS